MASPENPNDFNSEFSQAFKEKIKWILSKPSWRGRKPSNSYLKACITLITNQTL